MKLASRTTMRSYRWNWLCRDRCGRAVKVPLPIYFFGFSAKSFHSILTYVVKPFVFRQFSGNRIYISDSYRFNATTLNRKTIANAKIFSLKNNDRMLMATTVTYPYGSIPVAENAAIAFVMISLTIRCKFLDKYRPWEAKHTTNFISK